MYGEFNVNLFWALMMLLHMLAPVLLIILAVTLVARFWGRFSKRNDIPDAGAVISEGAGPGIKLQRNNIPDQKSN